ncbi:permease prefix domain 1-containing protein [Alicyclobacillus mengziensis]|uniref:Uncharacterized protein n=1 Tax=Alicyclobacillus mengziensis TaxID=2931921 RepID=A0A9X7Z8M3_9BACL|nr:permease prefix domain 1-containing protein [Alicyclobacillus mengziensis]QSO48483.1 hypothetical protein JZ786_05695 [Alicyclobacillus mengziensis]
MMTSPIQSYLEQVMRRSGLTKREKAEWIEEMSSHLSDEIGNIISVGHDEQEATKMALEKFGQPAVIRRKIAKETFGLSIRMIYALFSLFLIWLFLDLYIVHSQFPGGWFKRYPDTWGYVSSFISAVPNSPSLMLALCVSMLLMFKTRCLKDRLSILFTLMVFGMIWVLMRLPLSFSANQFLFGMRDLTIREPWVVMISVGFMVWGLLLYFWTRNSWVSITPILVSVATGLWEPFMYSSSHWITLIQMVILIAIRCIPIVMLLAIFRVVDKCSHRSVSTS